MNKITSVNNACNFHLITTADSFRDFGVKYDEEKLRTESRIDVTKGASPLDGIRIPPPKCRRRGIREGEKKKFIKKNRKRNWVICYEKYEFMSTKC